MCNNHGDAIGDHNFVADNGLGQPWRARRGIGSAHWTQESSQLSSLSPSITRGRVRNLWGKLEVKAFSACRCLVTRVEAK